jgi:hypothetical protein
MPEQQIHITEETFIDFAKDAPNVGIVMLYSLSKYYEKYKVTEWCMRILTERGFKKEDLKDFSKNFVNFFDQMIQQEDL